MSSRLSVCPSYRKKNYLALTGKIFKRFEIWIFCEKLSREFNLLQSDKNDRYIAWIPMYIYDNISLNFSWNEKGYSRKCRENRNIHLMLNNVFRKSYCFWENVENMVHPYKPKMTIQYGTRALHPGYPRLQTHIQNM
jgi:hypothetical protein